MKYILIFTLSLFSTIAYGQSAPLEVQSDSVLILKREQSALLKKMYVYREKLIKENTQLQRLQEEKMRIHAQISEILREDEQMKFMQDLFNQLEAKRQAALTEEKKIQIDLKKGDTP